MARQNFIRARRRSVGGRWTSARTPRDHQRPGHVGQPQHVLASILGTGLRGEHARPLARLLVGAPGRRLGPLAFDDREVGDGAALERAEYRRRPARVRQRPAGRRIRDGIAFQPDASSRPAASRHHAQASLLFHALQRLDSSSSRRSSGRPANTATPGRSDEPNDHYLFGKLGRPRTSAPPYGHLHLHAPASRCRPTPRPSRLRHVHRLQIDRPIGGGRLPGGTRSPSPIWPRASCAPRRTDNPDFEDAAINLNLVLRWEYRLGATLYPSTHTRKSLRCRSPSSRRQPD